MKYVLPSVAMLFLLLSAGDYLTIADQLSELLKTQTHPSSLKLHEGYMGFGFSQTIYMDYLLLPFFAAGFILFVFLLTSYFVEMKGSFRKLYVSSVFLFSVVIVLMVQIKAIYLVHSSPEYGELKGNFTAPVGGWFYSGLACVLVSTIAIFVKFQQNPLRNLSRNK